MVPKTHCILIFRWAPECLVDQLLGQYMADLAGLGPLLNSANIRRALESIYQYNYKRSQYHHDSVERAFTLNDEGALLFRDYTKGGRPDVPFPYYSENFTGSEYGAAILMVNHGMVKEGVEVLRISGDVTMAKERTRTAKPNGDVTTPERWPVGVLFRCFPGSSTTG